MEAFNNKLFSSIYLSHMHSQQNKSENQQMFEFSPNNGWSGTVIVVSHESDIVGERQRGGEVGGKHLNITIIHN